MDDRLRQALARAEEVAQQLADPATARNPAKLKQLGREIVQVISPDDPGMGAGCFVVNDIEAVLLEHVYRRARSLDEKIVFAGAEPEEFQALF